MVPVIVESQLARHGSPVLLAKVSLVLSNQLLAQIRLSLHGVHDNRLQICGLVVCQRLLLLVIPVVHEDVGCNAGLPG